MSRPLVAVNIIHQGTPEVNTACGRIGEDTACIYLELSTKYCEIFAVGDGPYGPEVCLGTSVHTPGVKSERDPKHLKITTVSFPELLGWRVHSANVYRYTAAIAFIKV